MAEKYGMYTPWMQNELLQGLNNNPRLAQYENIRKALETYKTSASDLQDYVEFMKHWDMIFARTAESYANMLAFDLQIICKNVQTVDEYNSAEYEEDLNRIYQFLDAFDYKEEFRKVLSQIITSETGFYWFRKTKWGKKGMKCTLQIMPQQHCMLTGYWENGLLYDFDMTYFLNPGVDIDGFASVFKKYYNKVFNAPMGLDYNPTAPLRKRDGSFALWTQTSPVDGAWAFKRDLNNFNSAPFLAPSLLNSLRDSDIEQLQYDKNLLSAYAILAGELRLFDNAKSGTGVNQFAIDPNYVGVLMGKIKTGLLKNIKSVALPTENTKFFQYDNDTIDLYNKQLSTTAASGTGMSRVIYSSDRMSNAELQYATEAQYQIMKVMYPQFNKFLEFYANRLTKHYKFAFAFEGCSYEYERQKRFDRLVKFADKGIVLNESAYAAALGMRPQDFSRSLSEGASGRMQAKLTALLNANTMKSNSGVGRPRTDDAELTPSGEASRQDLL